jgi:hypothetical protein
VKFTSLKRSVAQFILAAALVLVGCAASGPTIRSQADPAANFGKYHAYAFYDEVAGSNVAYSSFIANYLKQAISRELESRGYGHDAGNPDLLVNFQVVAKDKISVSQGPSYYTGYRRGLYGGWNGMPTTDVRQYKEGTLNIDLVDRATKQLVWTGVAVGQIHEKALDNPQPAIDSVVARIFTKFQGTGSAPASAQR